MIAHPKEITYFQKSQSQPQLIKSASTCSFFQATYVCRHILNTFIVICRISQNIEGAVQRIASAQRCKDLTFRFAG